MTEKNCNDNLTISAVIPAYNAQKYIARAIDSVLAQSCPVDEIIIVDDGSTDDTANVIKNYGDKLRYIYQQNAGVSVARNTGIHNAKGNWIAFLDADDEWLPGKIELQAALIKNNPDLVWTTGNFIECLCQEQRRAERTPKSECLTFLKGMDYYESYFKAIQISQPGHTICMFVQKKVFAEVGYFNRNLSIAEDVDMWLRIGYQYPAIGFSAEPLAVYHLSSENSLMKQKRNDDIYGDFIERHFELAKQHGMLEQFNPVAIFLMKRWIRSMLFSARKAEVRELLRRFRQLFSPVYSASIMALTVFPRITAFYLHLFSKIIRGLKLRRRVMRRP